MAKTLIGLYMEIIVMNDMEFLNIKLKIPNPVTNFEDCFGLRASVIFLRLQYVWCPVYLNAGWLPNPRGQLA